MLKRILIIAAALLLLAAVYVFGSGFVKTGSAFIGDYEVSEDGTRMTFQVGVSSSVGYVRKASVYQQMGGKLYLDCYSAFGGINGSLGARSEYIIPLDAETESILIYRNTNCYEEVLRKVDGKWQRVG